MLSRNSIAYLILSIVASLPAVEAQSTQPTQQPSAPVSQSTAVPNNTTGELRDFISPNSTSAQPGGVESFFQIPPDARIPKLGASREAIESTSGKQAVKSLSAKSLDATNKLSRGIWHVLDNLGIPMFYGTDNADFDPRIQGFALVWRFYFVHL